MRLNALKTELATDPLGRGYAGMSDDAAAVSLNAINRSRNRPTVLGSEILNATDGTEFALLTDVNKSDWLALCGIEEVNTGSGVAKQMEVDLFGPGTATRTALIAVRNENISRATELGLGSVRAGTVNQARNL